MSVLLAGVHLLLPEAGLALHVAAPADLAVAGQRGEAQGCVVAPPTAQVATACVLGTGAPSRAE